MGKAWKGIMRTVMVTGVGGFIGSRVARRLVQDGVRVVGVDDFSSGHRSSVPPEVDLLEMDLSQPDVPKRLPRNCGLVLHLAGQSSGELSFRDPADDLRRNTVSTLNLIRYASENTVDRIVFASSMSVYGDVPDLPVRESDRTEPLSCYGIAKLASERYLRLHRETVPSVILRMFNVYGPGQDLAGHRPEAVLVGSMVDLPAASELFARHVQGRPDQEIGLVGAWPGPDRLEAHSRGRPVVFSDHRRWRPEPPGGATGLRDPSLTSALPRDQPRR